MTQARVVIVGGGIAGLSTALALRDSAYEVIVLERDAAPPSIEPGQAFERWQRPGVPQFRHAHMFLARLVTLVRDHHPSLYREWLDAGLELSSLDELLPASHVDGLVSEPGDRDLSHLWGRRPTFEYVMRRHVERLPHVHFIHDVHVDKLQVRTRRGRVDVTGVEYVHAGRRTSLDAELVVDASGKRTRAPQWLAPFGVHTTTRAAPSDRFYVCRHYRWLDPEHPPVRRGGGANLGFFGYATFFAEHGHYAITLSCPTEERELIARMREPAGFEALCREVPVLADWIARSQATSKVLGAGDFANRWSRFAARGPTLCGFVPVGDSQLETNPMYGRGCASAMLQAHVLAQVLASGAAPERRLQRYQALCQTQLEPHFDFCVGTDNLFRSRARQTRGEPLRLSERLLQRAFDEAFTPAADRSLLVAREMIKAMQMRELSPLPRRFRVLFEVIGAWLHTRVRGGLPALPEGPTRQELLVASGRTDAAAAQTDGDRASHAAERSSICAKPLSREGRDVVG